MNDNGNDQRGMQEIAKALKFGFYWSAVFIFSGFLASRWLTRLLFERVLNPLTNDYFARNDGAVVLVSAAIWTAVSAGVLLALMQTNPHEATLNSKETLFSALGMGATWGTVIGGWLVLTWWSEVASAPFITFDFTQLLNLPPNFYRSGR